MPRRSVFAVVPFTNPSGAVAYRVRGVLHGRYIRENYGDAAAAESARASYQRQLDAVVTDHRSVLTWLTADQVRAAEQAQRMLGERSLVEAVESFLERAPVAMGDREFAPLVRDFLREIKPAVAHETHENLRKRLELLQRDTGIASLVDFTFETVESWVFAPHLKGRSQINRRAAVSRLAAWLAHRKRRLVPANLLEGLPEIKAGGEPPRRLTVPQIEALMHAAARCSADETLADGSTRTVRMFFNYVLRTFGGLRPSEVLDLAGHGDRINLAEGYVFVGDPRTRTHRAVKLTPSAKAWLTHCADVSPELVFKARLHDRVKAVAGVVDVWQPDICRHTFGSFLLRRTRSENVTADEMGNSVRVVRGFYAVPLTDEELAAFDQLLPPGWRWKRPRSGAAAVAVRV